VIGINETDKKSSPSFTIVKLVQFIVIDPLGIIYFEKLLSNLTKISIEESEFLIISETFQIVST
jgi:hypothetical protein